jgi:hypothetical protein
LDGDDGRGWEINMRQPASAVVQHVALRQHNRFQVRRQPAQFRRAKDRKQAVLVRGCIAYGHVRFPGFKISIVQAASSSAAGLCVSERWFFLKT